MVSIASPRPREEDGSALGLVTGEDEPEIDDAQSGIGPKRVVAPEERPHLNMHSGLLKKTVQSMGDFAEIIGKLSIRNKKKQKKQDHHGDMMGFEGIFFDRDSPAKRQLF